MSNLASLYDRFDACASRKSVSSIALWESAISTTMVRWVFELVRFMVRSMALPHTTRGTARKMRRRMVRYAHGSILALPRADAW
jgi:hypothetical protein